LNSSSRCSEGKDEAKGKEKAKMKQPKSPNSGCSLQFLALCGVLFLTSACATSDKSSEPPKPAQAVVDYSKPARVPVEPPKPIPSAVQQPSSAQARKMAEEKQADLPVPSAQLPVRPAPGEEEKPSTPLTPSGSEPEMVSFDFEDADLQVVLRALGKLAGMNFVIAQGVKAQVTMRIEKIPVTEAFSIIEAILQANNLAAVKSGDIYKIVPVSAAQQQPTRIGMGNDLAEEKGYFTQIVPLQYLSADGIVNILQPLVSQGRVIAHRETNTVVLSGPASVIREVVKTLKDGC
jgi:type II secretory pathway component HofQ